MNPETRTLTFWIALLTLIGVVLLLFGVGVDAT
jgi:hypothetical protein